jgi:hypothetical protein
MGIHWYLLRAFASIYTRKMMKLFGVAALLGAVHAQSAPLPEIDLGYEIYQAASFNVRHQTNYPLIITSVSRPSNWRIMR